jgi:uncharacterized protein (TIGR00251 family)
MSQLRVEGGTVSFWLRVKPRSPRERLKLDASGELRLELQAPPVEGEANAACIEFLARWLRVPRAHIEIVVGAKSRRKLIRVRGGEEVARRMAILSGVQDEFRETPH